VSCLIFILIIVSFALLYFFLSVYLFIAPLFWGEINALPLDYSLGAKFRHLVVKIAVLFVLSIIFPKSLPSPLLHFFLSIYPWSSWFPWGQGVQGLSLSNMQFYNTIYNITQYNNTIAFSVTSGGTTTLYSLTLTPSNYVVSEFTAALQTLMNRPHLGSLSLAVISLA